MQHEGMLITVYRRVDPYLYGAVSIVEAEAIAQGRTIPLEWSYPYVVSKQLADGEIVYGSVPHLIGETAKPIFRMNHRIRNLEDSLPEEIRSSMQVSRRGNAIIYELPASGVPDWLLHQQEELMKEGLLLSGLHLRTLLEILSGKRNISVPLYDYDGNSNDTVTLNDLFHILMHRDIRVVSITGKADDTSTGKLLEAIIESVDEFYSGNLAQEVVRGMREAASRGFWVTPNAPYGYRKVYVKDGAKKRPKLELDPPADAEGIPTTNGKKWLKTHHPHHARQRGVYGSRGLGNQGQGRAGAGGGCLSRHRLLHTYAG